MLVDVPEDSAAVSEETFGPTLTITKVATAEEGVDAHQRQPVRAGRPVFGKARAVRPGPRHALRHGLDQRHADLRRLPSLPFGGVGDSGFGRIHGDDGLREFSRPKAITRRRMRSAVPSTTYARKPRHLRMVERITNCPAAAPATALVTHLWTASITMLGLACPFAASPGS